MRILGIDPGTSLIGYGIIDVNGRNYKAVSFGFLRTASNIPNSERVKDVYDFFKKLIKKYKPNSLAVESLFFFKNIKTVLKVSEIRGVLLLTAAEQNLEIREFTPLQVKQAVSGYGRADKKQVQRMVEMILGMKLHNPDNEVSGLRPELRPRTSEKRRRSLPDDVTDALAIAICCANTREY